LVDSGGSQPITTIYTNDNSGLSQVLVSDDGTTQTHNLLGRWVGPSLARWAANGCTTPARALAVTNRGGKTAAG
jgi:hypothetical protein